MTMVIPCNCSPPSPLGQVIGPVVLGTLVIKKLCFDQDSPVALFKKALGDIDAKLVKNFKPIIYAMDFKSLHASAIFFTRPARVPSCTGSLTLENNILFCKAMVGLEISHSLGNANISMLLHSTGLPSVSCVSPLCTQYLRMAPVTAAITMSFKVTSWFSRARFTVLSGTVGSRVKRRLPLNFKRGRLCVKGAFTGRSES
mmetsp:Transcript_35164/g.75957  ORF Transcript_35164/g.75957 Transcript_35164/m.75957 type:complete len:200 (+) Transcript_35164:272-871(+)